jgi:hypothetical protein
MQKEEELKQLKQTLSHSKQIKSSFSKNPYLHSQKGGSLKGSLQVRHSY